MEEARKALFEKAIKKYTLKEMTRHATIGAGQKNLFELISKWPGHGQGFKVYKKTWPEGCFYHIHKIQAFVSDWGFKELASLPSAFDE